ncbi:MAG: PIN domain-containing protein, partial [Planctomycetes bacterium]|nr:PIN domain-containing protein [Planctomycetota bacterium]
MGKKRRLKNYVLDTNVVVSALLFEGSANQLVLFWKEGHFGLLVSANILKEYTRV